VNHEIERFPKLRQALQDVQQTLQQAVAEAKSLPHEPGWKDLAFKIIEGGLIGTANVERRLQDLAILEKGDQP
jgi:hypothetical protein